MNNNESSVFNTIPSKDSIRIAFQNIKSLVNTTPILTSRLTNEKLGCNIWAKCENFQRGGSFKYRGASLAVSLLDFESSKLGVCTHSSGNHAQALSLAALNRGIRAYVVMPDNSPDVKINGVKSYGGIITYCKPTLEERESTLESIQNQTGAKFIHPYNDYRIIHGQSTCFYEMLQQLEVELDYLIVPVGGGGLMSGTLMTSHYFSPKTKIIGAEPAMADDAYQSFKKGSIVPSANPRTIADGLKTSLGSLTFPLIIKYAEDIITVQEKSIKEAMFWVWEKMKIIIEPSAAVSLAVIMERGEIFRNKNVGVIFSGGNVDIRKPIWD